MMPTTIATREARFTTDLREAISMKLSRRISNSNDPEFCLEVGATEGV